MKVHIRHIILLAFVLRVGIIPFTNLRTEHYYEYGEIAKNLLSGKGYSLFYYHDSRFEYKWAPTSSPEVSAYMPPGYVWFLTPFIAVRHIVLRNLLLLTIQALLSTMAVWLVYEYTRKLFSERAAFIAAVVTAINPEFIYAVKSFTPTAAYHCLILLFLIMCHKLRAGKPDRKVYVITGVLSVFLVYLRSEFLLFAMVSLTFLYYLTKQRMVAVSVALIVVFLAPWGIRNYLHFHQVTPVTTNLWMNVYRGNNEIDMNSWSGPDFVPRVLAAQKQLPLEMAMERVYKEDVISYISKNPSQYVQNTITKFFDLWVLNTKDTHVEILITGILSIGLLIPFLPGIQRSFSVKTFALEYSYFALSTITAMLFFVLPRYQTMLHMVMVPFCAVGIDIFMSKWGKGIKRSGKEQ